MALGKSTKETHDQGPVDDDDVAGPSRNCGTDPRDGWRIPPVHPLRVSFGSPAQDGYKALIEILPLFALGIQPIP